MSLEAFRLDASSYDVPNVVVVDPSFDAYKQLATAARLGKLNLHFRSGGAEAMKLSRRRRVDAWLIAPELDDMSGHDFLELLQSQLGESKTAMVESVAKNGRHWSIAEREAVESGADSLLAAPITFRNVEELLGLVEKSDLIPSSKNSRAFVTLPVAVGAAVLGVAILMIG